MRSRPGRAAALGLLGLLTLPALVLAHPLGNFTINHYAGLRVEPDRIQLDVVIDQAEIPAFQARQELDRDGDGEVSDGELERGRIPSCRKLGGELRLVIGGSRVEPTLTAAGLSLHPGVGGLQTLRLVCGFEGALTGPIADGTRIEFEDGSYPARLGWREIVVEGSGVTLTPADGELRASTESARLTAYPQARLESAIVDERIVFEASPGGAELPPFRIPDAQPVDGSGEAPTTGGDPPRAVGAVPGGIAGEIPALFQAADLSPIVVLLSVVVAAALGAAHALTPGHGKTLVAAYLVGTRGTPVHALGLGLSVSVSHTIGILFLALLVIGAQGVLDPDLVARVAPLVAAVTIVGIGAWMLIGELRRRSGADEGEHSHDGVSHRHDPAASRTITWRSLFLLGLAGGIIPSTNALLILLGTIATGRPAFGLVLVVSFGVGMALVLVGVGLVLLVARGRLDAFRADSPVGRLRGWVPLGAACVVLVLGLYLTVRALVAPVGL